MKARREGELLAGSWRRSQKWEIAGDNEDEGKKFTKGEASRSEASQRVIRMRRNGVPVAATQGEGFAHQAAGISWSEGEVMIRRHHR